MKTERIILIRRNPYLTLCLPALLVLLAVASSRCPTMAASGGGLCSPPADGLVGWWRGEGNANDTAGANNGTVQPGTSFAAGMVGQAFSFNPANGTVIVPDSPSLRLTNQLTIEAWINNRITNGDRAIVSKIGGVDGNNGYQMYMRGDKLMAQFNSLGLPWPAFVIQSPLSFATGVWYHVAWTYDQSAMKLYINGLPWATNVVGPHPIAATRSTLRLSGDDNNHVYFDGLIDEASIYNRALSASEIAAIYNASSAGKCPVASSNCVPAPAGLVGWWPGQGNANDAVGINNGTVQPGTSFTAGTVGQAFSFNPANGTMIVPDSPSLRLTNQLTIEAWINNRSTNSDRAIVSKVGGIDGNNGYQMYMRGDKLMAQFNSLGLPWPAFVIQSPLSLATGVWYHVAWTYDQSAMKLYVNGLPWATNAVGPHPIAATRSTVRLSGDDNNHVYFDGLIDEASIYNRALSASEITTIYNAGSAGKCPVTSSDNCVPAPADMVSWWRAEANILDAKGMNNGSLQNGVTFTAGRVGQAFNFDGLTGSVLVPDSGSLRLTNQFTLEAWVNTRSTNTDRSIVSKVGGAGGNNGYQLAFSRNALLGQFNQPGQAWPGYRVSYPAPLVLGTWNHVACTYDQSALKLYWNGVPVATNTVGTQVIAVSSSNLRIGDDDSHNTPFDGLIDEPTVYRRALSAGEIAAIYGTGSAGKCPMGTPPSIVTPPASQTATAGSTVSFNVTAVGDAPLRYQWRFQGANLPSSTNSSLTISNVQLANAGSYSVVVSNFAGSVTSSNALLTVVPFSSNCVPAPAGLVSWWRAEGAAADSGGTNNGVLEGGVAFGTGEVGQAFSFNGTNADVRVPASASLNVGLAEGFTIETWVNPQDVIQRRPVAEWNNGSFGVNFSIADASGAGPGSLWIDVKDTGLHDHFFSTTGGLLVSNVWQHVAVTYAQTNGATVLYINGVQKAQATLGVFTPRTIGDLYLGVRPFDGGAGARFVGLMDEVSLYRRALSADEIAAIYHAGITGKCPLGTPPSIVSQPQSQTVLVGGTAAFSVTAVGDAPLRYQWRFQGANLASSTNSSLTISNVQLASAGSYSVMVSNLAGAVTSSNALLTVIGSSSNCVPAPAGLVSWWRAEGAATDSGGTNNGVLEGGVAFGTGEVGQAFSFNGTNADVRVPASASLNVGLAEGFTIETWVNPRDVIQRRPVAEWNNGSFGVNFSIADASGAGPGSLWIDVKDTGLHDHFFSTTGGLLVSNVWQHVAVTYAQTNGATVLYINGVQKAQATLGVFTPRTIGDLYLGVRPFDGGAGARFVGLMDEVSLYRRALSASEIAAIYNAGSAGKCPMGIPPSILSQPQSQTLLVSGTAAFSVTAVGDAPLRYQWRFQGVNLPGNTNSSLTLSNVQLANAGSYSVVVSNLAGSVTSSNALLTVVPVSSNCLPASAGLVGWWRGEGNANDGVGINNGTVQPGTSFAAGLVGQAFSFNPANGTVIVPDSPSLRLTNQLTIEAWINNRSTNSDRAIVSKVGGIDGNNGYQFYMRGDKLTAQFNSLGLSWPAFVVQSRLTFATGVWYHVAWTYDQSAMKLYVNGLPWATNAVGSHPIAATRSTLRLSGDDNNHVYFDGLIDEASIYNRALSASEIGGIYNAGSAGKCPIGVAPSIVSQPQSQTVLVGGTAAFSITAAGDAPLRYQWRFQGANLASSTNSSLTISNVQLASAGSYSVIVSNLAGSVTSSNALLTVIGSSSNCVPAPAGLVSWWRAEGAATDSGGTNNGVLEGGVAFGTGEVGQAFSFNGTNADVRVPASVSLNVGLAEGFTIETWVNPRDVIQRRPVAEWNNGSFGVNFSIADASGAGPGSLWIDVKDTGLHDHFFSTAGGLLVSNVWQHVAVTYAQTNGATVLYINGVQKAQATLGVFTPRTIGDLYLGVRPFDGGAGARFVGLMDEVSLYRRALSADEIAAIYHAGSAGKCPLGTPPSIVSQPQSQTALVGGTAAFSVTAVGDAPLRYQWRFQGANLASSTNSSLTISNVQLASAGSYSVIVSNLAGSVTSSNALLTVIAPSNNCVPAPAGLVSWWRAEGAVTDSAGTNTGFLEGGVAFGTGEVGQAFTFNGTNADVRVPTSASLNVGLADGFTIESWINPADVNQWHPMLEWNNGSFGVNFSIGDGSGAGHGALWVSVKDTLFIEHPLTTPTGLLVSNVWQHVAVTYAKTNGGTVLYLNGVPRAQAALGAFTPRTIGDLYLGVRAFDGAAGGRFVGLMDEVTLYRRALSADEIAAVYHAGSAGKCPIVINAFRPAANPVALPTVNLLRLHSTFHSDGSAQLDFLGRQGKSYRIEVSADLVDWATLGTCTAGPGGNTEFIDLNAAHHSPRFYRAVEE